MTATTHPSAELKYITPALLGGEGQRRGHMGTSLPELVLTSPLQVHAFHPHHTSCLLLPR